MLNNQKLFAPTISGPEVLIYLCFYLFRWRSLLYLNFKLPIFDFYKYDSSSSHSLHLKHLF